MPIFLQQHFSRCALFLLLAFGCIFSHAVDAAQDAVTIKQFVSVTDAWVRPTNAGQEVGAAYMTLSSTQDVTLVHVKSDVAKSVEIHSMTMQNGIMKMRMLDALPLSAGKPYKLAPGGFHLMLFDLEKPLTVGEQVNFVLYFKKKNHVEFKQNIKAMVQSSMDGSGSTNARERYH